MLRQVNNRLAPYGRKLGPDPASESACTIGGVVANNSSGMTCGTEFNTYRTLESLLLVLPSGTVLDTGAPDADERLRATEPELHAGLLRLRDRVRGNPDSVRRVRAQYAMKNTMGYGVNAFLDHDSPSELLTRLVVGSEGTLAFVAAATFRTVPVRRHAATGLLVFDDLARAMAAMPALVAAARRRSSCSTPPRCGSPSSTRRRTPHCAAWPSGSTPRCWSSGSCRPRRPRSAGRVGAAAGPPRGRAPRLW
ncbi:FAD-binding protein [Micromonospora sp. ATA51]|uniref:FAD-binding oxidoreductase n=1 Tax=Micromonospora sp. ATA51 TaxID=2806098 RepID=UPI0028163529|nr:FAD-binding protein [Micromonospora sp. ATA51]